VADATLPIRGVHVVAGAAGGGVEVGAADAVAAGGARVGGGADCARVFEEDAGLRRAGADGGGGVHGPGELGDGPGGRGAVRVHAAVRHSDFELHGDLLQHLALKLGIVTGRDLAQACRDHYSRPVALGLWVLCEV